MTTRFAHGSLIIALAACCSLATATFATPTQESTKGRLGEFLARVQPGEIDAGADRFGEIAGDLPAAPLLKDGKLVGYAFLNADIVDATGYSGKPINIVIGLDSGGHITGARLVEHHEPIVLVGIAESKVVHFIEGYIGRDVLEPDTASRTPADIVSGATVSMMVIGDTIMRSALKIARSRGIGGATAVAAPVAAAHKRLDPALGEAASWQALLGDGSVRRLALTTAEVNEAFARTGNAEAIARPEGGPADAPYVDLYLALASIPTVGRSLLGDAEYATLVKRLKPGQLDAQIRAAREKAYEPLRVSAVITMLYTYRALPAEDLDAYATFYATPPARWFVAAVRRALVETITALTEQAMTEAAPSIVAPAPR